MFEALWLVVAMAGSGFGAVVAGLASSRCPPGAGEGFVVGCVKVVPDARHGLRAVVVEDAVEQCALAAEGAVETALAQAGRRRDAIHAGPRVPGGPELVARGTQHATFVEFPGPSHESRILDS